MVVVVGDDSVEACVIKMVTKDIERSIRGIQDKDIGVYITSSGRVKKSLETNKGYDVIIVKTQGEDNKDDGGIEGN